MPILRNIAVVATPKSGAPQGELQQISDAAIVWTGERISWLGAERDLPAQYQQEKAYDAERALVIPGLVDCHTHLAFGGWREQEFVLKCEGQSYEAIARAGGGIVSTVSKTRDLSEAELVERCFGFLSRMSTLGVTTVEAKSGYGLDLQNELKLLRVYKTLSSRSPLTVVATLLAAHTIPLEFKANREQYISLIIEEIIPQVAAEKLASFCDIFVEKIAFTPDEARRILTAGKQAGMLPKLHVDQLSDIDGATLAAEVGAISADHLEYTNDAGLAAMAKAGTVAVSLPIATLYTRQPPLNARRFLEKGLRVAVATDFNPGSAPSYHLPLALMLGCTMNRLTPAEALTAGTLVAAEALGLSNDLGSIATGKRADLALLRTPSVEQWLYHFEANSCFATIKNGACISGTLKTA